MIKKFRLFIILGIICTSLFLTNTVKAAKFIDDQTVDSNKTWTLKFTREVGFDDLTKNSITVTDNKGNKVDTEIKQGQDTKTLLVTAPQGGYTPGKNYTLNIGVNAHSKSGKPLKNEYKLHFNIKSSYVITFKSNNLEKVIRNSINKPIGDIYKSDVENITSLDVSSSNIDDITGIENLTNLQILNLSQNHLSHVSVLRYLPYLRDLDLSQNEISDINELRGLNNLYYLNLNNNEISDISELKYFTYLHMLLLNANEIVDIEPLQGLTNLQQLSLKNNRISSIIALRGLTNLNLLYLGQNKILDYSPTRAYYNKILNKDFDLIDCTDDNVVIFKDRNLEKAVRSEINKPSGDIYKSDVERIVSLKPYAEGIQDISGIENLINLQFLDLSQSKINDISELKNLSKLQTLLLNDNEISDIGSLQNLTDLKQLDLEDNRISDITPLQYLSDLSELSLKNNRITNISRLKWLTNLKTLYLSKNQISDYSPVKGYYDNLIDKDFNMSDSTDSKDIVIFKDENLEKAVRDKINKETGDIYITDVKNIISLNASHKNIKEISGIENLTSLQTLDLGNNQITDISVLSSLTNLEMLNLSYNEFSDISKLKGLTKLETLNLKSNEIQDISAIQILNNLKSLNLSNCKISNINSLKGLNNLKTLWLNNNEISDSDKEALKDALSNCNIYYDSEF
ncbi:leucine-rich repeat domain-containing protein [Clostridium scatologenes]|uniref:Leucine-rich repeat protein n=1 Tax=Clostridium scatologenes TaxID=1548 RepID=A0A0E3M6W6_CLOSL|nr:leucine-rich repeat domain-containing protein [Clostridium scatologenes]AKA68125.1 leucine-rich repeat protein [Clostridium scatologenes]